jgi:putative transposase
MTKTDAISIARACKIIELDRSMFYYQSRRDDTEVENKLREYASKLPTRGFPEYFKRIRKEGLVWNHKRVKRVYKKLGLSRRRKVKRRVPTQPRNPLLQPLYPNLTWSMDFMHDSLESGRKFRSLNIIDDYNREALDIVVDYSIPGEQVVRTLEQLIEWRGKPEFIRTDNGPEFRHHFEQFCADHGITPIKTQPGKPSQNGYVERFNRTLREDVFDAHVFSNLTEVRQIIEAWMEDYNHNHPHDGIGGMTPKEFAAVNCGKHAHAKAS